MPINDCRSDNVRQYAFRKEQSGETHLIKVINDWAKSLLMLGRLALSF